MRPEGSPRAVAERIREKCEPETAFDYHFGPKLPLVFDGDSPRARLTDRDTSHEAADSNTNRREVEEFVRELFDQFGPMNDHELTENYFAHPFSPDADQESPRKRRSDLTGKGELIALEGVKRPGRSGRNAQVWQLVATHAPIDATCPACNWPERIYDSASRTFGCPRCEHTSDKREP